jgi:hypothetical protein
MIRFSFFITMFILTACNNNKTEKQKEQPKSIIENISIDKRLENYFYDYEIEPSIIINNTKGDQTFIELGKHKINWIDTEDETRIKIDNDLFTLKDKVTLNNVWGSKDSIDFANNWDEIKLFESNERELIGIRMSFKPCTGLGCSVDYYLIYDVKTKTKNFFGQFRVDRKMALYHFDSDLSFVSKTYRDSANNSKIEFIYELFSIDKQGQFKERKNANGFTYQIKHSTFPYDSIRAETLEQNWIQRIK